MTTYNERMKQYEMRARELGNKDQTEECLPRCPRCQAPAICNLRGCPGFIPDEVLALQKEFEAYLEDAKDKKTVLLELGVGFNTPGVIRYPFQRIARLYPQATLVRFNRDHPLVPDKIKDKSIEIGGEIGEALEILERLVS